jgi:ABC-type Fe3+-hydroxamate transport system substrate-binding protein
VRRLATLLLLVVACQRDGGSPTPQPKPAATAAPARLVSLTPSATEIVAALGATSQLVGVDDYSTYPPEVTKLPKVGSFLSPNLEAIVRLRPTLVVVDDVHQAASGALQDAGLATVECPIHDLPDVKRGLVTVGERIGKRGDADAVVARIDAALDEARRRPTGKRPRVLAIIDREAGGLSNLVAAGPGSWVDELLAVVGGANVLGAAGVRYPKIAVEEVLKSKPDVILDLSYAARAGIEPWSSVDVPAVRDKRVRAMAEPFLIAPSPRVKEAIDALTAAIAPPSP